MFSEFYKFFGLPSSDTYQSTSALKLDDIQKSVLGFSHLLSVHGGNSFRKGLYRLHQPENVAKWNRILSEAFPNFGNRISCFGYDWLGRHFALDSERVVDGQPQVLMLEPGTGEVLEIQCSFLEFHNDEIPNYPEACLASDFFDLWIAENPAELMYGECAGYKVPLFLGGDDSTANLERSNMEVYWHICSQLIRKTNALPNGTNLNRFDLTE